MKIVEIDGQKIVVHTAADALAGRPERPMVNYTPGLKLKWSQLVKWEPRLKELQRDIKAVKDDPTRPAFCANLVWYKAGGFKVRLCHLVGWDAEGSEPLLHTPEAYDLAYDRLYELLPPCRNCNCL